ncbi:MAG: family N-acetyltransferase [Candidatus Poribacteria bacterium]|nr:family N-acetyltransferase [Candidatus Poribacteria bacterium]
MIDGPRGAKLEELDDVSELANKVFGWHMRDNFPTLFCKENIDNLRIIKVDGKVVSLFGFVVRDMIINGCRISVGNVGAVCTDENHRKKGYAWSILDNAIVKYRADGVDMLLVSGGRGLYIQHGCTHAGKVSYYAINRGTPVPRAKVVSKAYTIEDLPAWSNLYRNEPVRFQRPYNDFQVLTTSGVEFRTNRLLRSIWSGDQIVAYAVVDKHKHEDIESLNINEYAGSRKAILGSIPQWIEEFNVSGCVVTVPTYDQELKWFLDSMGLDPSYRSTGGTMVITNFPQLCMRLMPLFEEIIGISSAQALSFVERDGSYVIGFDGNEVVFNDAHDIVRVIFGDPPGLEQPTKIPADGKLLDLIKAIFPVPRPEYGLSYI